MNIPTVAEALRRLDEVRHQFEKLVQESRTNPEGIHLDEFARNLADHRKASDNVWEARFASIADTGAKVRR
jgi:enolase